MLRAPGGLTKVGACLPALLPALQVEVGAKLFFTGALQFIEPDTTAQVFAGLSIAFTYMVWSLACVSQSCIAHACNARRCCHFPGRPAADDMIRPSPLLFLMLPHLSLTRSSS